MPAAYEIDAPTRLEQAAALELAWGHVPRAERRGQIPQLLEQAASQPHLLAGLRVARREGCLVGAVWAQMQPGSTAFVSLPGLVDGEPDRTAQDLLESVCESLAERQIRLLQALVPSDGGPDFELLCSAGFRHYADLLYLVALPPKFPDAAPRGQLEFLPYDEQHAARLTDVIERTYANTQDCPQLNGIRDSADVIAGYRGTGELDARRWFILRRDGADVGCLLLAEHPHKQWELVYMGLVPEARGRGCGILAVRHAQWLARCERASRLVLAVDAANQPAISMYAAAGFTAWGRRSVLLRISGSSG